MLGTAGAIGAQLFVLTGYGAEMVGPAFVLAIIIGGLLSYSIALNYGELATMFPETGGAMTYVREAWGRNLLSYLVGSLDCLSSTFFAALSAVGFAYSLRVFLPALPIVPTALGIVLFFITLNLLGVGKIGNVQVVLGGVLLVLLLGYITLGFILPGGFRWETFVPNGKFFIHNTHWDNFYTLLSAVALAYVAYIGFEVLADDAEEIKNPDRALPLGILISLTVLIVLYPLIVLVTLGTISWPELSGSETAMTDAAEQFLPHWGPIALGMGGIVATLTSLNTALLSATREAFTLSRDGMWPRVLSRMGRFRTPYVSVLLIGFIVMAVAAIGLVDFLSYISSSGYLFVLFWSNLALVRLRHRYPDLRRPFKAPFFPLTAYLAVASCILIISFTEWRALAFGAGLLLTLTIIYYAAPFIRRIYLTHIQPIKNMKNRILVPIANPRSGAQLVKMASILAQASEGTSICVFNIELEDRPPKTTPRLPEETFREAFKRNVPIYTKNRSAESIADGILEEIETHPNIKFVLMGWPGPLQPETDAPNPVKILLERASTNIAVLLSRNPGKIRHILVPIGGGLHSRLALRMAYEIADQENAQIIALHIYPPSTDVEDVDDKLAFLREVVLDELGSVPARVELRVVQAKRVTDGVLQEARRYPYDLLVMGASEEYGSKTRLFGSVDDWIVEHIEHCSVLLVRQHEAAPIHWLRRNIAREEQ